VSACATLPTGADGDLANQWPAIAAPAGWSPVDGACQEDYASVSTRLNYRKVECSTSHSVETVFVGEFTGAAGQRSSPPPSGTPELAAAWGQCDVKATEFVGAPWRHGKLRVAVSTPSAGAWSGGARWFICQVGALAWTNREPLKLDRSLKGELAAESVLKNGCHLKPAIGLGEEVPCTTGHDFEFAGTVDPSLTWAQLQDQEGIKAGIQKKCLSVIAAYVGVPDDRYMRNRTGLLYTWPAEAAWEAGDHHVRCYLWPGKQLTRSLKGTGAKGLPILYA
jgi:hypothetical protein